CGDGASASPAGAVPAPGADPSRDGSAAPADVGTPPGGGIASGAIAGGDTAGGSGNSEGPPNVGQLAGSEADPGGVGAAEEPTPALPIPPTCESGAVSCGLLPA